MAHIQKIRLKKGTAYRIYYYKDSIPRQKYISYKQKKNLKDVKKFANQLEANELSEPFSKTITLKDFKKVYSENRKHEKDISRNIYALNLLISFLDEALRLDKINHVAIHRFRDHLLEKRLTQVPPAQLTYQREQKIRRGVNKELANLRTIFRWAKKKDYISTDVFEKVDFLEAAQPLPNVLSSEQEKLFYKALPKFSTSRSSRYSGYRLAWLIMRFTGLRRKECMTLKWENIDFNGELIFLERTKNGDEVFIPLHPKLKRILKFLNREGKYSGRVIPYGKDYLTNGFRRALNRAGLSHLKSPVHILRHTYITKIVKQSKNIYLAQKAARHKNVQTTKIYEHVALAELKKDLENVNF